MKKILVIASIAFVLSLSGCVGWAHWGTTGERNRRPNQDQRQDQHQDQPDNRYHNGNRH
jgi:hypothetical protein